MVPKRATASTSIRIALIAPCGMNCRLCRAFIREKMPCPGCRGDDSGKAKTRRTCRIKNCERLGPGKARYCGGCDRFPCDRLIHLDERYRTRYGMSMIDNLTHIREYGIRHFLNREKDRWRCPECGRLLCVHQPQCLNCRHIWR